MAEQGCGRIVNISSRSAFRGEPEAPAYAASKAGLNALSQSLAKALASQGVYVFVVAPGWVSTQRVADSVQDKAVLAEQPLGRVATPEEVAQVVTYCTLDAPASMTGAILDVNGASYLRTRTLPRLLGPVKLRSPGPVLPRSLPAIGSNHSLAWNCAARRRTWSPRRAASPCRRRGGSRSHGPHSK
jgi:hypothetical protein